MFRKQKSMETTYGPKKFGHNFLSCASRVARFNESAECVVVRDCILDKSRIEEDQICWMNQCWLPALICQFCPSKIRVGKACKTTGVDSQAQLQVCHGSWNNDREFINL